MFGLKKKREIDRVKGDIAKILHSHNDVMVVHWRGASFEGGSVRGVELAVLYDHSLAPEARANVGRSLTEDISSTTGVSVNLRSINDMPLPIRYWTMRRSEDIIYWRSRADEKAVEGYSWLSFAVILGAILEGLLIFLGLIFVDTGGIGTLGIGNILRIVHFGIVGLATYYSSELIKPVKRGDFYGLTIGTTNTVLELAYHLLVSKEQYTLISLAIVFSWVLSGYLAGRSWDIAYESGKATYKEYAEIIVTAVVLTLLIQGFIMGNHVIPTGSMIPTLHVGDRLFSNRFIYKFSEPRRGDVFIFRFPEEQDGGYWVLNSVGEREYKYPQNYEKRISEHHKIFGKIYKNNTGVGFPIVYDGGKDFIKRLIGLPGDEIKIVEKELVPDVFVEEIYVNGKLMKDRYASFNVDVTFDHELSSKEIGEMEDLYFNLVFDRDGLRYRRPGSPYSVIASKEAILALSKRNDVPKLHRSSRGSGFLSDLPFVIRVPKGRYFAMGDNRDNSRDSRYWGPVPKGNIQGRAMVVYFPPNRIKLIK
ncbi:MAG: signal peptidase I [bacterium]